jgi:hypothetical protein
VLKGFGDMAGIYCVEDVAVSLVERRSHSSSPRLFLTAVFISLTLHLVIMAWYKPVPTNLTQLLQSEDSPLRISLVAAKEIVEPVEPVLPNPPSAIQPVISKPDTPAQSNPVIDKLPPPEDFQTTIRRSSAIPDKYRLTQEDLAQPSVKPANVDEVFHPHLRKKLQAARSKRTGTISASIEAATIHGETVVMVDEGRCMSSDGHQHNLTRASDWYFTHCNNGKTEGELMMERVNQRTSRRSD